MQFNTGSSSSTDLSNLIHFYNNSDNPDVVSHWMGLYEEQKITSASQHAEWSTRGMDNMVPDRIPASNHYKNSKMTVEYVTCDA